MNTKAPQMDYGLDETAMATIEAAGQAKLAETLANKKPTRPGLLDAAEKALKKGKPIPLVVVDSPQNLHQNRHFRFMHRLYCAAWNGVAVPFTVPGGTAAMNVLPGAATTELADLTINGNNTYAKARTRYRDLLCESLNVPVDKRPKIVVTEEAAPITRKRKAKADEATQPLPLEEAPTPVAKEAVAKPPKAKGKPGLVAKAPESAATPSAVKTYSSKSNATKAAWKEIGRDAVPGADFEVYPVGEGFAWRVI